MFEGLFMGTVDKVFPPNHQLNKSKFQYEYEVLLTHDGYSQLPARCIVNDPYGSSHNFEDGILTPGNRVFVMFPRGEGTVGVIMGGVRSTKKKPQNPAEGYFYRHRFNEIEEYIDNKGAWHITSDDGPNINVSKTQILFDDSNGDKITLDKETQTLTIECTELRVIVKGNANITVQKDANITVQQNMTATVAKAATLNANEATVNTKQNTTVNSAGDTIVKAKNVDVEAKGNAKVKAKRIDLNQGQSGVTTANSHMQVIDFITGIPVVPSKTVFADV